MSSLLEVRGLSRRFGGYAAVSDVDLDVRESSIHAVIGPNGAGKTTLFNLLSGVLVPSAGSIRLAGRELTGRRPDRVACEGLVRTFQSVRLFASMTVLENVQTGCTIRTPSDLWSTFVRVPGRPGPRERAIRERAMALLARVGLAGEHARLAVDLPLAQQRRLEIARALATEPRLLLLDEPVAGMNPVEVDEAAELIARIRAQGVTVLLTEHHMSLVMKLSDAITVLHHGRKLAEGTPAQVRTDPQVLQAYLGDEVASDPRATQGVF